MPSYELIWARLVERAVMQGEVDATTRMTLAVESGIAPEALMEALENDLDNNGPIFGKFLRSVTGAAQASVMAAGRQGEYVGRLAQDRALRELSGIASAEGESVIRRAIDDADPQAALDLEELTEAHVPEMWVAELVRTCHRCLPLHGQIRTRQQWKQLGLLPETIHDGWDSSCHCRLVEATLSDRDELRAPLVRKRQKLETATKLHGQRTTARSVTQKDLERALAARDEAMNSPAGRRTLRILGTAQKDGGEDGQP